MVLEASLLWSLRYERPCAALRIGLRTLVNQDTLRSSNQGLKGNEMQVEQINPVEKKNYLERTIDVRDIKEGWILHGVNCKGVMGSGIAKALRDKYPEIYPVYKNCCDKYGVDNLGSVNSVEINRFLAVVNCFTQASFGYDKTVKYASANEIMKCLDLVEDRLCFLDDFYPEGMPFGIYLPRIGCGLGGLDWETEVKYVVNEFAFNCKLFGVQVVVIDNKS
jgi:O-acetyl-ADP-ribose deacetylase (regulator of RNase III)